MKRTVLTRVGVAVAVTLAGLLIAPGPAAATARNRCFLVGWIYPGTGTVEAELYRECVNPESSIPLNLTIQRYDPGTDLWVDVATGRGHAAYTCTGTTPTYYHMTALPDDYILLNCS